MANPLRNAMVYFGLADEDEQMIEETPRPAARAATSTRLVDERRDEPRPAPVTPIAHAPKAAPVPAAGEMNEILTVHPKAYNQEAKYIAETFRDGVPVIMNVSEMAEGDARRIIDFASGLAEGLGGKIERVTKNVFLISPEHVVVHGDEREQQSRQDASFFS